MKTIIFDIDGTITNMWPIEKAVLLSMLKGRYEYLLETIYQSGIKSAYDIFKRISKADMDKEQFWKIYNKQFILLTKKRKLPKLVPYPTVGWILKNKNKYHFVYATGGQKLETEYSLSQLKVSNFFDLKNSVSKSNCRFSKHTGIPLKKIKSKFPDCLLITDSQNDCIGAIIAQIPFIKVIFTKDAC